MMITRGQQGVLYTSSDAAKIAREGVIEIGQIRAAADSSVF